MKTPILGSAYVARSINAADNRMVNLFPEIIPEGGKEPAFLNRAPGLNFLQTIGTGPIRGLWAHQTNGTDFYVVSGTEVYKLTGLTATPTKIGDVSGTGPVSIADNGAVIFFACNGPSYTYYEPTGEFDQITDANFPGAKTVSYLDTLFVFNEPDSQRIWSVDTINPANGDYIYPLVFNALDFSSADGSPDGVVAVNADHRQLWVFGTDSTEVWYNAGLANFPLSPIQGAFNEIGCVASYSVAKLDNTLFWLGTDARGQGIVYRANGYNAARVSTHAVEYAIAQYGDISDALAYTYQEEGHSFYMLTFPSANATWCYDVATQAWHVRAGWENGEFTRHRSNCQCNFGGNIIVGDFENGNIYTLDLDVYADNGEIQKWLRSWRALPTGLNNLKRTAQHSLQLDCETGVGLNLYPEYEGNENIDTEAGLDLVAEYVQTYLVTQSGVTLTTESGDGFEPLGQYELSDTDITGYNLVTTAYPAAPGYNPEVMLRWSDDGGHTWSNEHWSQIGKIGAYGHRTFWRRLGMTLKLRDRVYELSGTDPVKIAIIGAELILSPTNA
jgi:hypothetical protein